MRLDAITALDRAVQDVLRQPLDRDQLHRLLGMRLDQARRLDELPWHRRSAVARRMRAELERAARAPRRGAA